LNSLQKILKKTWVKPLFSVLFFCVLAGFLFLSVPQVVFAAYGGEVQVLSGGGKDAAAIAAASDNAQNNPSCGLLNPLGCVLGLVKVLMQASASLFAWIVAPGNQTALLTKPIIYTAWTMVRDLLNVAFILVLLFSAFATIFQVEKYNYKKLLLNIILMALLVNFSFPIARFIIDTSNVLMYSLINRMTYAVNGATGTAKETMGALAFGSQYATMLDVKSSDMTFQLSAIVFGFIMAITLLAIAVMFVIRMVALAILIIFSPVAFVAAIIPGTSNYSSQWWNSIFKYAFFGPIMIFILYISSSLIIQMGAQTTLDDFKKQAINQTSSSSDAGVIAAISFYSIPIVILWFGMAAAQSMGGAAAGSVMSYAQKVSKGGMKKFSGYNAVSRRYGAYKAERKKRDDEKFKGNLGSRFGKGLNEAQDKALARLGSEKAKKRLKSTKTSEFDEDSKKATDRFDTDDTHALVADLHNPTHVTAAVNDRSKAVDYAAKYKQVTTDPVRREEFENSIRTSTATTAAATAAANAASASAMTSGMSPAATQAYVQSMTEAAIKNEISKAYGTLKANYQTVKKSHIPA